MEETIQEIHRYFQHAATTHQNTFTSASVLATNASKTITLLKKLIKNSEFDQNKSLLNEVIDGLSKAESMYEKYCESLDSDLKGNDQLFINLNHVLYNNLETFLKGFSAD